MCWSPFLIQLQVFKSVTFLKRDSNRGVFNENCEFFKNAYFDENL